MDLMVNGDGSKKKRGKSYEVKEWFANKVANEVKRNISMCDVFAIMRETDKAVYAMLNLGCDFGKCMWIPKSVLIEQGVGNSEHECHYETIFEDDYNKCIELFEEFWNNFK